MSRQVNIAEAKAKLSELVEAASRGEEIVLARHGKPMARLSSLAGETGSRRRLGVLKNRLSPFEIKALTRSIERPLSKSETADLAGGGADAFGISHRAPRARVKRATT